MSEKAEKIVKRLVLDAKNKIEPYLKYFNAENSVKAFINDGFFSENISYDVLYRRFVNFLCEFDATI